MTNVQYQIAALVGAAGAALPNVPLRVAGCKRIAVVIDNSAGIGARTVTVNNRNVQNTVSLDAGISIAVAAGEVKARVIGTDVGAGSVAGSDMIPYPFVSQSVLIASVAAGANDLAVSVYAIPD